MLDTVKYVAGTREQDFLDTVQNSKYDRQIIKGLRKFIEQQVPDDMQSFYSESELQSLRSLMGGERDIEARMPVKITRHYLEQARKSPAMRTLVKASPRETMDLAGSPDPAAQLSYSPVEGLLHKYELALIYVASTCSAHCRFCYREELIAGKELERDDGSMAAKSLAKIASVVSYISEHNELVIENDGIHPETGRPLLREVLLSGGDPMVLSNRNLAAWLSALAESGIESIRIGTKELAFFPGRFDDNFLSMLDAFHEYYPRVNLRFMVHFNHPDEFLEKEEDGSYMEESSGGLRWLENTHRAVHALRSRSWISIDNQAPIIRDINDDANALRIMQRELRRNGLENHYFFCGRDIIGHKAFNVPIEEAWQIVNESQKGLSGVESHARLVMAHYRGKVEVVAVTDDAVPGFQGAEEGLVIFKLHRAIADASERSSITMAARNREAIWIDGYQDRVLMDEAGLFQENVAESQCEPAQLRSVSL